MPTNNPITHFMSASIISGGPSITQGKIAGEALNRGVSVPFEKNVLPNICTPLL